MVFYHVPHLKVFVDYKIARFYYVQRRLNGEVFTLPANLQMFLSQLGDRFLAIVGAFLFPRSPLLQPFQSFFTFAEMSRIRYGFATAVGIEMVQSHVYPNRFTSGNGFFCPFYIYAKLGVITVGSTNHSDSFDLCRCIEM